MKNRQKLKVPYVSVLDSDQIKICIRSKRKEDFKKGFFLNVDGFSMKIEKVYRRRLSDGSFNHHIVGTRHNNTGFIYTLGPSG